MCIKLIFSQMNRMIAKEINYQYVQNKTYLQATKVLYVTLNYSSMNYSLE